MKTVHYFFYFLFLLMASCSQDTAENLMQADRDFSSLSAEIGMKQAFLDFADDTAVLLQSNAMPVVGKQAIMKSFEAFSDTGFVLTWEPLSADISKSRDLGYTYGLYSFFNNADSSISRGKYVSIWKKQDDGSWKFVLDGGNEGI
ncbi:YybH family protein [Bacteroidota bacterium]